METIAAAHAMVNRMRPILGQPFRQPNVYHMNLLCCLSFSWRPFQTGNPYTPLTFTMIAIIINCICGVVNGRIETERILSGEASYCHLRSY